MLKEAIKLMISNSFNRKKERLEGILQNIEDDAPIDDGFLAECLLCLVGYENFSSAIKEADDYRIDHKSGHEGWLKKLAKTIYKQEVFVYRDYHRLENIVYVKDSLKKKSKVIRIPDYVTGKREILFYLGEDDL